MAEEQDPFAALADDGISGFTKFCIFLAVVIAILTFYFHGSNKAVSYKRQPVAERFSIEELESRVMDSDSTEEEYVKSSAEGPGFSMDLPEASGTAGDGGRDEAPLPPPPASPEVYEGELPGNDLPSAPPASAVSPLPAGEKAAEPPQPSLSPSPPSAVIPPAASYDTRLRQPVAAKGDWKKKLPDLSTLVEIQRVTPVDNETYDAAFNDVDGAISISRTLGKPSFYFRRPHVSKNPGTFKLSVMVYGLGLNMKNSLYAANSLPAEVSLSYSVYSDNLQGAVGSGRKAGHETFLDIPLQADDYPLTDPGNLGLLQNNTAYDNRVNLIKMLSKNVAFIGFFSMDGEAFTRSSPSMSLLAQELKNRGLVFYDANRESMMAQFKEVPFLKADVIITREMFAEEMVACMQQAKKTALAQGAASLAVDSRPLSIYMLRDFLEKDIAGDVSIELVPVSVMMKL